MHSFKETMRICELGGYYSPNRMTFKFAALNPTLHQYWATIHTGSIISAFFFFEKLYSTRSKIILFSDAYRLDSVSVSFQSVFVK